MNKRFLARVVNKTLIAEDTYEMVFSFEKNSFEFIPGQYVWIILPDLNYPDEKGFRRAFSITSSNSDIGSISIIFRKGISGYKKTLLEYSQGTVLEIDGPFGSAFEITPELGNNLTMISGGVGIAPFLGILRSFSKLKYKPKTSLINFNFSKDKQIFSNELKQIAQKNNITVLDYIGPANLKEFINDSIIQNCTYFICGPQEMVDSVYQQLRLLNVEDKNMVFEEIYPCSTEVLNL